MLAWKFTCRILYFKNHNLATHAWNERTLYGILNVRSIALIPMSLRTKLTVYVHDALLQDGGIDLMGEPSVGVVTEVKGNGWVKVRRAAPSRCPLICAVSQQTRLRCARAQRPFICVIRSQHMHHTF